MVERKKGKNSAHFSRIINGYIAHNAALLIMNEFAVRFSHVFDRAIQTVDTFFFCNSSCWCYSLTHAHFEWRFSSPERERKKNTIINGKPYVKIRVKEKRTSSIWEHEKEKWATKNQRTPKKNDISRGKLDNLRERELVSQVFVVFLLESNEQKHCSIYYFMIVVLLVYQTNFECSWINTSYGTKCDVEQFGWYLFENGRDNWNAHSLKMLKNSPLRFI